MRGAYLRRRGDGTSGPESEEAAPAVREEAGRAPASMVNGDGPAAAGGGDDEKAEAAGGARGAPAAGGASSGSGTRSPAVLLESDAFPMGAGSSRPLFTEARQPRCMKRDGTRFVPDHDEEKPPPKRYAGGSGARPTAAAERRASPRRAKSLKSPKSPGAAADADQPGDGRTG